MEKFNEKDVRAFWKLLGHHELPQSCTEVRAINPKERFGPHIGLGFFVSEDAFVDALAELAGKYNLYAGRNARPKAIVTPNLRNRISFHKEDICRGGRSTDIEWISNLSLDIDAKRPNCGNCAATEAEHLQAIRAAQEIAKDENNPIISSGNGAYPWFPVHHYKIEPNKREEITKQLMVWEDQLRSKWEHKFRINIDNVYDLARIVKIPGTLCIKGENTPERPHRMAKILQPWDGRLSLMMDEVTKISVENIQSSNFRTIEGVDFTLGDYKEAQLPARFSLELLRNERVRQLWLGNTTQKADHSRSGLDYALAAFLAKNRFTVAEIATILWNYSHGKARTHHDSDYYLGLTIRKAMAVRPPF